MSSAHGQNSIFIAKEETALLVLDRGKTFGTMQEPWAASVGQVWKLEFDICTGSLSSFNGSGTVGDV